MALVYRPLARNSRDEPIALKRLIGGNNHCWPSTVPPGCDPCNPTDGACHVTHWQPLPRPPVLHASDCAVHNAPALPVGPCDCGAEAPQ